ncbi:MAG: GMC family oxidoreductase N-terminal domain-containing protein [Pseudorhodoferax sp.]
METHDYIVVGAGSSGCAVAGRLSEDPSIRVLLVEAGPPADDFWIRTPAGMARLFLHQRFNWNYFTEPVPTLNGRKVYWPRGKVLGGSSAINGMVYMRGHPRDYDHWESLGNTGWGWNSVLDYFKRSESNARGASANHGGSGPWRVSDPVLRHPSSEAFIAAAVRTGIPPNGDLNGPPYEGVGYQQFNIHEGRRQTAYDAFIRPVRGRPNLTVLTDTQTLKVCIEGRQATGIEVQHRGQRRTIAAAREVVLSGGVINSPQLLMLSGIGPAAHLHEHGIAVRVDAPEVGRNLHDHWFGTFTLRTTRGGSYNQDLNGLRKYWHGLRYLLTGRGYLALGASPLSAYVRSSPELEQPDLQLVSRAMTFNFNPKGIVTVDAFPGISAAVVLLQPRSRGHLHLRSADPLQPVAIHPRYLDDPEDGRRFLVGMRRMRQILATEPMAARVAGEQSPGAHVTSDEDLLEHIRNQGATAWHPVGTCRMGVDAGAVVDPSLRVRGIDRLRVADASVMPRITSGNTSAPAVMIGEKAADMIRATPR